MKQILIIADDLTGAAEIGGIARDHGLSSRIHLSPPGKPSTDATIIDTDSRSLNAAKSAAKLTRLLSGVDPSQFDLIYKKNDSVLRGPIAAEIQTVMNLFRFSRCLFIPQNPSRGRVIENGHYILNNIPLHQTLLATDPEHPATTSYVANLLDPAGSMTIHCAHPTDPISPAGITIGAGTSADHIRRWAGLIDDRTLAAGAADFFTAILQSRKLSPANASLTIESTSSLIICGSASTNSRSYIDSLRQDLVCPLPINLFDPSTATDSAIETWSARIRANLAAHGKAVLAIRHPIIPQRAPHLRRVLAETTAQVLSHHPPSAIFIEGGATAAAIVNRMNWEELDIAGQLAPGVVALRPTASTDTLLILKPGSYPWPKEMMKDE